ncbi:MAG TPA: hypothetical protein VGU23_02785 [Acidobacteriaceae bacterium]|nr:hypothetical protein [Acidobacteriaceae bacterium]
MGQQIEFALKESMHRVLVKLASFLPGLLALLVAVVALTAAGALLAFVIRRVLVAAKFDERFARSQTADVTDWSPGHSPTALIARVGFWVCVLLGFIVGISAFDASYSGSSQIAPILIPVLTRAVGAVLILLAGTVIARYLSRSVLIGGVNLQMQYARFLSAGVKWLVLVLTAAMALDHLEIGGVVVELAFGILFGGIVLTLALAIGLGSRDLVSRSLEKTAEPKVEDAFADVVPATQAKGAETLRHF